MFPGGRRPIQELRIHHLGEDLEVARIHAARHFQLDRRSIEKPVSPCPRSIVERVGEVRLDPGPIAGEPSVVLGVEQDPVPVGDVGVVAAEGSPGVHAAFKAALELDRLQGRVKESCRRPLE